MSALPPTPRRSKRQPAALLPVRIEWVEGPDAAQRWQRAFDRILQAADERPLTPAAADEVPANGGQE